MARFDQHTTARVGGPAGEWITAQTEEQALDVLARHRFPDDDARAAGEDTLLILGGGSNLLVADAGFSGTVLQLAFTGICEEPSQAAGTAVEEPRGRGGQDFDEDSGLVTVAAGHWWDDVVAWSVSRGYAGLEALSGIPGCTGATPVQNVGAYGAEVSHTLVDVRAWDRASGQLITLDNEQLEFGYRTSLLKRETMAGSPRYVVLSVRFQLVRTVSGPEGSEAPEGTLSAPVRYAELARSLGLDANAALSTRRAPLQDVREKVLALRAGKGMVLDPADHDTWSTGSFFTNPIVPAAQAGSLPGGAPRFAAGESIDADGAPQELVKLSAAWLIDNSGCGRGFGLPEGPETGRGPDGSGLVGGRASLSTKHTLAVTNRGTASTSDMLAVARAARERVRGCFGIALDPEPVLIGCRL